ncbi:MAG: hypothetical protein F6K40_06055, partial [Okeania sp. SIO3I5]|nr:hypothetical protein [Okeania sp. SIO3I5]
MSNWEFLLQKEGDQSWLPLESADVEILEGRYRIVANTHIANTEVQIRIIHDSTEEIPPLRRAHKRFSRTHSQGLISIIPFTRLKPGKWEFRCQAKLSTSSKEAKQHIVHLEVLPTEYDTSDFSQQLEPQNNELYTVAGSQPEPPKDLIINEDISFFSGQVDTNEVTVNGEENTERDNPELSKIEEIKSDERELLDGQIEDESKALSEESEMRENITDLLGRDEQEKPNIQGQNQEVKNLENKLEDRWFVSGQVDTNEVTVNREENIVKNNPELSKIEVVKSDERELLDGEIEDESKALSEESEMRENITDLLGRDEQEKPNIQGQNQEVKNLENKLEDRWFVSGQVDTNEVTVNREENIVKNNPELSKIEVVKSDERELLDGEI